MNYDTLETEIAEVLNDYFAANLIEEEGDALSTVFSARQMPENQAELERNYNKSEVCVHWGGSDFGQARSTGQISQDEEVFITCYLRVERMKGNAAGYRLLDCVKKALLGYKPEGTRNRMVISAYGDYQFMDGELQPYIEFKCSTILQQIINDEEPAIGGDLTTITSIKTSN